jgi:hypothetical protein
MSAAMPDSAHHVIDVWLPNLARLAPDHPLRGLLPKADRLADGARGYMAGLSERFDAPEPLPAAALTRQLIAGDAGSDRWLCADPAWVQPDLNGARLLACGQMQLSMDDALALAEPLMPLFDEADMALLVSSPDRWHVRLSADTTLPDFAAPEQALGEDLYYHLPQGVEGRRWRILLTEVQVILHQHPLNAERRQRGLPPINQAGIAVTARTEASIAAASPGTLIDLQDLPEDELAARWSPSLLALARRQPLQLSFASGERWLHRPWHRLRVWRRSGR